MPSLAVSGSAYVIPMGTRKHAEYDFGEYGRIKAFRMGVSSVTSLPESVEEYGGTFWVTHVMSQS